ncbi:Predicted acetyltransferase [Pelagirhabdus alkalitolerans]|uniref:Predicted acetyltransferase n=2 Tax=Pelagirhabdus alkalitolerans TaxID=1612202 RepID=A0A1G6HJU4_9BACI|nr:Predicted acetyltransferase [Pelagirhabdus alkalitolerans]
MFLVKPSTHYENQYMDFYNDWKSSEEEMVPFVIKKEPINFQSMLDYLLDCEKGIEPPENWIPENSTYWLIDNQEVIGVVNIRHYLTKPLFNAGGHIGYGIRPSKRNNGYATQILSLALEKARDLNLDKVLLVCHSTNTASKKIILKNGGEMDNDYNDGENILNRFWIYC